jgi:hypothetical protein
MLATNNPGRLIGILLLLQFVGGILVNLVLTAPLFGEPGFLVNGAIYSRQIGLSALMGLGNGGLALAVAITAWPTFRRHSNALAIWFIALSGIGFAAIAVEQIGIMSMVSFSEAYSQASAVEQESLGVHRVVVTALRNWGHYTGLLISGCTLLVMYIMLFRFTLVPRALSGFGLIAVALQIGVISRAFFGIEVNLNLLAPLGLSQIALIVWLLINGFAANQQDPGLAGQPGIASNST